MAASIMLPLGGPGKKLFQAKLPLGLHRAGTGHTADWLAGV